LPKQTDRRAPSFPAGATVDENLARRLGQSGRVIEFAAGQEPGIGCHGRAAKTEPEAAAEIDLERAFPGSTRRVRHARGLDAQGSD